MVALKTLSLGTRTYYHNDVKTQLYLFPSAHKCMLKDFCSLTNPNNYFLMQNECRPPSRPIDLQICRHVTELALLQLGLPKDRVRVLREPSVGLGHPGCLDIIYSEAVLNPTVLLDVIQVNEATGKSISVRSCEDAS